MVQSQVLKAQFLERRQGKTRESGFIKNNSKMEGVLLLTGKLMFGKMEDAQGVCKDAPD